MAQQSLKPKIIHTTLQNLFRSSSFSKAKTQQSELRENKNNILKFSNLLSKNTGKKNVSRHGLKSKDKITDRKLSHLNSKQTTERSQFNFICESKAVPQKRYFDDIQQIYLDLEVELHRSKKQFFKNVINNFQNELQLDQDLKRLVQKSAKIKQMLHQTKQQKQKSQSRVNSYQLKELNSKELENIDLLSRANRKNQNQLRLKKSEGSKKPTVYEQVLKRKM